MHSDSAASRPRRRAVTFSASTFCCLLISSTLLLFGVGTLVGYLLFSSSQEDQPQAQGGAGTGGSRQAAVRQAVPLPPPKYEPTCMDTCAKARNGVCEDGSQSRDEGAFAAGKDVLCDLGTDCADCGPWTGAPVMKEPGHTQGPVEHITAEGHKIRIKTLATQPEMAIAYTDPKLDFDVSDVLERVGVMEGGITQIFYEVLRKGCIRPDGSRALVLDVGANFGYFSVYAALLGCRVIAWEPVPLFRAYVHYNLQRNNVTHLVQLRDKVVGPEDKQKLEMMVPKTGIWGTASVAGINQFLEQAPSRILVEQERMDSVVKEDVLLLKVDVEGYETMVVRSMTKLTKNHLIENYILEYSPGIAERLYPSKDMLEETPRILINLMKSGYRIMQLNDNYGKAGHVDWHIGIPPLPEVTLDNLWYDLRDAKRYKEGMLGCPKPIEMFKFGGSWSHCNYIPEDLHPKSFHSMFAYNTNIWAAHTKAVSRALMKAKGPVGLHSLTQNSQKAWSSEINTDNGIAMKVCMYLDSTALVRSRCNCSWAVNASPEQKTACREEEQQLEELLAAGKMPWEE